MFSNKDADIKILNKGSTEQTPAQNTPEKKDSKMESETKSGKKKSSIFSLMSLFGGKKDKEKEEQKIPETSSITGKAAIAEGDPLEDEDILKIDRL